MVSSECYKFAPHKCWDPQYWLKGMQALPLGLGLGLGLGIGIGPEYWLKAMSFAWTEPLTNLKSDQYWLIVDTHHVSSGAAAQPCGQLEPHHLYRQLWHAQGLVPIALVLVLAIRALTIQYCLSPICIRQYTLALVLAILALPVPLAIAHQTGQMQ